MERCLGWMIVAALLAGLTACSVAGEKDLYRTNEGGRHETAHRQTTGAPARQENLPLARKPRPAPTPPLPGITWPSATRWP